MARKGGTNNWARAHLNGKKAAQGSESVNSDRGSLYKQYLRSVSDNTGVQLEDQQPAKAKPAKAQPAKPAQPKTFDVVVYRPRPGKWVAFKKGKRTNTEILQRIAKIENDGRREWARPIRPGDFNYVIMSGFADVRSARDAAKAQGDALLAYKSPFAKPSGKKPTGP